MLSPKTYSLTLRSWMSLASTIGTATATAKQGTQPAPSVATQIAAKQTYAPSRASSRRVPAPSCWTRRRAPEVLHRASQRRLQLRRLRLGPSRQRRREQLVSAQIQLSGCGAGISPDAPSPQ
jgi:hypothetical protein